MSAVQNTRVRVVEPFFDLLDKAIKSIPKSDLRAMFDVNATAHAVGAFADKIAAAMHRLAAVRRRFCGGDHLERGATIASVVVMPSALVKVDELRTAVSVRVAF